MLDIILILALVISLGFLIWLIIKKIPNLANINVSNLPEFQVKKKKEDILKTRLKRDLSKLTRIWGGFSWQGKDKFFDFLKNKYSKLKELEKDLRRRSNQKFASSLNKSQTVEKLMTEAKQFVNNEEYDQAEDLLIDALSIDQYNLEVYRLLADVYNYKKEYKQAKETLQYLLKLTHSEDAGVFTSLAEIAKQRGNLKEAEEEYIQSISLSNDNHLNFLSLAEVYLELDDKEQALETAKRALLLAPNNPKVLDFLINISIMSQDKELAEQYLEKLKEVNPENQKIAHFIETIDKLK